ELLVGELQARKGLDARVISWVMLDRQLVGGVESMLLGDSDKQHRIQPRGSFGACCDAETALAASAHPGDCLRACRLSLRQSTQPVGHGPGVGLAKTDSVRHGTGVEAGAARGAKRREFRTGLRQKSFRGL